MRWPFQSKKATDIRIFRDSRTNAITLRMVGPLCLPSPENPIISLTTTMEFALNEEAVQRLYEQLRYFAGPELASGPCTEDAGLTGEGTNKPNTDKSPP
jgi:hypothetical protein